MYVQFQSNHFNSDFLYFYSISKKNDYTSKLINDPAKRDKAFAC